MLVGTLDRIWSVCPTDETPPACPALESALVSPAAVGRYPVSVHSATDLIADPAARQNCPDFPHPLRHCPASLAPGPRPSPDSSADTPCPLTSGPSLLPST